MLRFKNLLTELINNNIFNFMEKKLEKNDFIRKQIKMYALLFYFKCLWKKKIWCRMNLQNGAVNKKRLVSKKIICVGLLNISTKSINLCLPIC